MSDEPRPVIRPVEADALADAHTLVIDAWPGLRWIAFEGSPRTLLVDPSIQMDEIKQKATDAFDDGNDAGTPWGEVLQAVLDAIGVAGMLQEIADLTARLQAAEGET